MKHYHYKDTVIDSTPNADISKTHETQNLLYLGFKFSSFVLKCVMQGLKSEFCKNLVKKSSFDAKVTFCYFCIPSYEVKHF